MTAPGMSSKWGSFFQQAVAGVEARLDNMLSEGEYAPDAVKAANLPPASESSKTMAAHPGPPACPTHVDPLTQPPTPRPNPRLQERLAKAVANKSSASFTESRSADSTLQNEKPGVSSEQPRAHDEGDIESFAPLRQENTQNDETHTPVATESLSPTIPNDDSCMTHAEGQGARFLVANSTSPALGALISVDEPFTDSSDEQCSTCGIRQSHIRSVEAKLAEVELLGREERYTHVERVDALEAKLKFLTREMTESAQRSAASATTATVEKQLAEKDEKIALLMGEGQILATTEHKHRSIIKKLRLEAAERDKSLAGLREENGKLMAQLKSLKTSEASEKLLRSETETLRAKYNSLQETSSRLALECSAKGDTIKHLERELEKSSYTLSSDGAQVAELSEDGGNRIVELNELITELRAEHKRAAEKAHVQTIELRKKADKATEQSRQMKTELQTLEGKLEAMRVIAEEASSNAAGDAQAKFLRQIETLQSQYATACENWQGIETTLTSRIAILEKERDETTQKEASMRRKARDLSSQNRQQAEDMRQLQARIHDYQQDGDASQRDLSQLRKRIEIAEAALAKAHEQPQPPRESDGHGSQDTLPETTLSRVESSCRAPGRPLSPSQSPLQVWGSELLIPHAASKSFNPESVGSIPFDGPGRVHSPSDPAGQTGPRTFNPSDSVSPPMSAKPYPTYDVTGVDPTTQALSSRAPNRDNASDKDTDTLSTVHQAIPDVASISTTAAGPSIQLVERMSAGIRRLEAERVAGKEELLRISNQRDEARAELVVLMKEIESGREARGRVTLLEQEVAEINERYQTTLELLGEKSELVEELRADVQDVKAMYRELVERTIVLGEQSISSGNT